MEFDPLPSKVNVPVGELDNIDVENTSGASKGNENPISSEDGSNRDSLNSDEFEKVEHDHLLQMDYGSSKDRANLLDEDDPLSYERDLDLQPGIQSQGFDSSSLNVELSPDHMFPKSDSQLLDFGSPIVGERVIQSERFSPDLDEEEVKTFDPLEINPIAPEITSSVNELEPHHAPVTSPSSVLSDSLPEAAILSSEPIVQAQSAPSPIPKEPLPREPTPPPREPTPPPREPTPPPRELTPPPREPTPPPREPTPPPREPTPPPREPTPPPREPTPPPREPTPPPREPTPPPREPTPPPREPSPPPREPTPAPPSPVKEFVPPEEILEKVREKSSMAKVSSKPKSGRPQLGSAFDPLMNLIYWRDVKKSGAAFGATMVVLMSLAYLSLISVVAYTSLAVLVGTLSFRIYKTISQAVLKSQDPHPFQQYLEFDTNISSTKAQEITEVAVSQFNCGVSELKRLFLVEDLVDSIKFCCLLWCLTYVGSWFNGLTLVILGVVSLFTLPKVYEQNQAIVDQYLGMVSTQYNEISSKIKAAIPIGGNKEKAQ